MTTLQEEVKQSAEGQSEAVRSHVIPLAWKQWKPIGLALGCQTWQRWTHESERSVKLEESSGACIIFAALVALYRRRRLACANRERGRRRERQRGESREETSLIHLNTQS